MKKCCGNCENYEWEIEEGFFDVYDCALKRPYEEWIKKEHYHPWEVCEKWEARKQDPQ